MPLSSEEFDDLCRVCEFPERLVKRGMKARAMTIRQHYRHILPMLRRPDAEDAAHNALEHALTKKDEFDAISNRVASFRGWMHKIHDWKHFEQSRINNRHRNVVQIDFEAERVPDRVAISHMSILEKIRIIVGTKLSEMEREVFTQMEFGIRTAKEVAEELNITERRVYYLVKRAKKVVKEELQRDEES